MTVANYSRDVSDTALREIAQLAQSVGIPGHFIIEVWNSETGLHPLNTNIGGTLYFGPAAVLASTIAQQVNPSAFSGYNLEQRIPYMGNLLAYEKSANGGKTPDRPEVLYAVNFVPEWVRPTGGNPPGSFLLVRRNGQFWADNPAFQPYATTDGITVDSLGQVLAHKRATDFRLQELLSRYTTLTGISYPGMGSWVKKGAVVAAVLLLVGAGTYYAYARVSRA